MWGASSVDRRNLRVAHCECASRLSGAWQGLERKEAWVDMDAIRGIRLCSHGHTWGEFLKTYCTLDIIPLNTNTVFLTF